MVISCQKHSVDLLIEPQSCRTWDSPKFHFDRIHVPTIQEAFQLGIYWAETNTVHKSTALKLAHDLTSPRWKEGSNSEVVTLDEEGCVEADITLGASPGRQKVRDGVRFLELF